MDILLLNLCLCIGYALFIRLLPLRNGLRTAIFLGITFVQLILLHSFVEVNSLPDLPEYYDIFQQIQFRYEIGVGELPDSKMESAFLYLMKLTILMGGSFGLFLFICSLLIISPYYIIINKYSKYVVVSVVLVLLTTYNQSLYVLRQHMAMAMVLFSYPMIIERNLKKFLLITAVAFALHQSALVWLPVYFLYGIERRTVYLIAVFCAAIFLGSFFVVIMNYVGGEVLQGYEAYLNGDDYEKTNMTMVWIMIAYLLSYVLILKQDVFSAGENKLLLSIVIIALLLSIVGVGFVGTGRLNMYYTMVVFLLVPKTMEYIKSILLRYIYAVSVMGCQLLLMVETLNGSSFQNFRMLWQ